MGRNYVAWAVLRGTREDGFSLHRHGVLYPPDLGSTFQFGHSLRYWEWLFDVFVTYDLNPSACAAERFTYRPGGQGGASEDVNLRLPGMYAPLMHMVRNTDWKTWFHRYVCADGTLSFFGTPTQHEADAAGIAMYLGGVILPRAMVFPDKS